MKNCIRLLLVLGLFVATHSVSTTVSAADSGACYHTCSTNTFQVAYTTYADCCSSSIRCPGGGFSTPAYWEISPGTPWSCPS